MANKSLVPEAKDALNKFKMEAASDVGVTLKQGYNGDLTSKQAGSIGGQMVKNIFPIRKKTCSRNNRNMEKHIQTITYEYQIII